MGSEMCIRDRHHIPLVVEEFQKDLILYRDRTDVCAFRLQPEVTGCLLYTSDAADERSSVDLGGRRIIKKKKLVKIIHSVQTERTSIETTEDI